MICLSHGKCHHFIRICCACARARKRALMTRKSCTVGMRNAILTNDHKSSDKACRFGSRTLAVLRFRYKN